jgi:hypothetical protein
MRKNLCVRLFFLKKEPKTLALRGFNYGKEFVYQDNQKKLAL